MIFLEMYMATLRKEGKVADFGGNDLYSDSKLADYYTKENLFCDDYGKFFKLCDHMTFGNMTLLNAG